MFSSRSFNISVQVFDPIAVTLCEIKHRSNFILLYVDTQFSQLCVFIEYWMIEVTHSHVWFLYFVPLVHRTIFVPLPYRFHYYCSVIYLKIWNDNSSSPVLFAQDCFGPFLSKIRILHPLCNQLKVRYSIFQSELLRVMINNTEAWVLSHYNYILHGPMQNVCKE